ncbi:MAG: hypothetical protein WEE20_06135 [Bacteroidota bacterium]
MADNEKVIEEEFEALKHVYFDSKFDFTSTGSGQAELNGDWRIHAQYLNYEPIHDIYKINVVIPSQDQASVPKAWETGKRIPPSYHHFKDGSLCLGAPLGVKKRFREHPTLTGFFQNCFLPYLYQFSYKEKYGILPFGELSHGGRGILEDYFKEFGLDNERAVVQLIRMLAAGSYRGHKKCPCGSGRRLRDCHAEVLFTLQAVQTPDEFARDLVLIEDEIYTSRNHLTQLKRSDKITFAVSQYSSRPKK